MLSEEKKEAESKEKISSLEYEKKDRLIFGERMGENDTITPITISFKKKTKTPVFFSLIFLSTTA